MRASPAMVSLSVAEGMSAGAAEVALLASIERATAGRGPDRLALILHLSSLASPRPHHRRIAWAILDEAAQRMQGELFVLRNRDVVMVAPPLPAIEALSSHLHRLFRGDVTDAATLLSAWPASSAAMAGYVAARQLDHPRPELIEKPGRPDAITETLAVIGTARLTDLTRRQVGVTVLDGPDSDPTPRLRPQYAEVMVALSVLRGRLAAVGQAEADPYLFRHLAGQLDVRMLQAVREAVRQTGAPPLRVNLNLTIEGVLSPAFGRLTAAIVAPGGSLGIEVPLLEACGDPAGFTRARTRLREEGVALLLDGVTHHTLAVSNPAALEADWVKLEWADAMAGQPAVLEGLTRLGPDRVILTMVETAAALSWGLRYGIRAFQGRHIDAALAEMRLRSCPAAAACVQRQCQERAYATGAAGRVGCANPGLLDLGAPA